MTMRRVGVAYSKALQPVTTALSALVTPLTFAQTVFSWLLTKRSASCFVTISVMTLIGARSAHAQLPDLAITQVSPSVSYDLRTLQFTGTVEVEIANLSSTDAPPTSVLIFGDRNGNQRYDSGADAVYGSSSVPAIPGVQRVRVTVTVAGTARFRDELIWAFVDDSNQVDELDEANNLGNSGLSCSLGRQPRFDPRIKWFWGPANQQGVTVSPITLPEFVEVICTPVVADIDRDGVPEVIFTAGNGRTDSDTTRNVLRVIRGTDGSEVWTDTQRLYSRLSHVAVGNLDDDPELEIVALLKGTTYSGTIVAYNHDGTVLWETQRTFSGNGGAPTLADLEGDGTTEVIYGNIVLNGRTGAIKWTGTGTGGFSLGGPISAVADVDLDGSLEVIAGPTVYRADGTILWRAVGVPDGFAAVANFDDDPYPEIVITGSGRATLLDNDGSVKWSITGNYYGAPAVGNVDSDEEPEIFVAGCNLLSLLEPNGAVKWTRSISDGSCQTGATVFDFEGDGSVEMVYRDERFLYVLDGLDGSVKLRVESSSATWTENPIIADVDADGSADIVVGIDRYTRNLAGVAVYESETRSWLPTRSIWNQHAYSITNVNDDGSIPRYPTPNWLAGYNNFRCNSPGRGQPPAPAADLTVTIQRVCSNQLLVRVGNGGSLQAPAGVEVSLYNGDPDAGGQLLNSTTLSQPLSPDQYVDVSIPLNTAQSVLNLYVVVNRSQSVLECRMDNNTHAFCTVIGDVDQDAIVSEPDLLRALFKFGETGDSLPEDVDCNGIVDDADLLIILFNYGSQC